MFSVLEWAQFWAQSVSTAQARVNPVVSPCSKACRRRRSPILCLELCPLLPSPDRSLVGVTPHDGILLACGFRAQRRWMPHARRTVDEARRRIREVLELFVDDARTAMMEDNAKRSTGVLAMPHMRGLSHQRVRQLTQMEASDLRARTPNPSH